MSAPNVSRPAKPETVFDRDAEWDALVAFACDTRPGASLAVVSGRLRQGKTYLLEALTAALGGFYFGAQQAAQADSLHSLGDELARYERTAPPSHWRGWEDAIDALLVLGDRRPVPVVVDEFPDLVRQSPALPSVIHSAYRRLRDAGRDNRSRLLLSGSALPVMHRLFSTSSPLRGLADLELTLRPLDFRQAARFWGIDDPGLALLVHAVVGGTPPTGATPETTPPAGWTTSTPGCPEPSSTPRSPCSWRHITCSRRRPTTGTGRCAIPRSPPSPRAARHRARSPNV